MALTDISVKNARGRPKPYKIYDSAGLYLLVRPDGARYWRFDYRFLKKRGTLAFGVYPDVSLSSARESRDAARKTLQLGKDPAHQKRRERALAEVSAASTFKVVAEEWVQKKLIDQGRSDKTVYNARRALNFAYGDFGDSPVSEIEAPEILVTLDRLQKKNLYETSIRLRSILSRIFRYAIATGRAKRDPAADLIGALTTPKTKHHAAVVTPDDIGDLLRVIEGYQGNPRVTLALKLSPYVFVRPGELRMAETSEFDWEKQEWRIPAAKTKMKRDHIVPLPRQAMEILAQLKKLGIRGRYLFSCLRKGDRPMSENTVNAALRRLGIEKEIHTGHGFRTTASTILNEMGWNSDWIERQLAHVEANKVRRAYNAAKYLPERKRMLQAWADYLDSLRAQKPVSTPA